MEILLEKIEAYIHSLWGRVRSLLDGFSRGYRGDSKPEAGEDGSSRARDTYLHQLLDSDFIFGEMDAEQIDLAARDDEDHQS